MHSYVCENDQPIDKEPLVPSATKCQRDLQDGSRDLTKCQEELEEVQVQLLLADCPCSNLSVLEAEAGVKEERISGLERELGEEKRLRVTKEEMISKQQELLVVKEERTAALERELGEERRLRGTKEELRKDLDEAEKERDALKRQLGELRKEQPKECPSQAFCKAQATGGRLAELETKEEITRLKTHMKGNGYYCGSFASYGIGSEVRRWETPTPSRGPPPDSGSAIQTGTLVSPTAVARGTPFSSGVVLTGDGSITERHILAASSARPRPPPSEVSRTQ
ncbi:unnamed protein product [Cyprideis torosa]|uniref:Uncharacterized protein n=1 Tax=Cyprideis torosa TaxID=163714 RepID=A0A7R8ZSB2_9CRUS|nr:unnamed protein product [Cyprideis torosa]CAG0906384.1 unnamed protein product [Cyprideis torosa]